MFSKVLIYAYIAVDNEEVKNKVENDMRFNSPDTSNFEYDHHYPSNNSGTKNIPITFTKIIIPIPDESFKDDRK